MRLDILAWGETGGQAFDALLKYGLQFGEKGVMTGLSILSPKIDAELMEYLSETEAKNPKADVKVTSFERYGVFFGKNYNKYIVKPELEAGHIMVVGGTGSGKSSCIAIPTLRCWGGSIFAIDIKGELHEQTHNYRKCVKVLDPTNEKSAYYYDPYVFLKNNNTNQVQEARAITEAILPLPPETKEPFWIESSQTIITGAILHYYSLGYSFIETLKKIQSQSIRELVDDIAYSPNDIAALHGKSFVGMKDETLANIHAEMSRGIITLVTDKDIIRALSPKAGRDVISPVDLEKGQDIYIKFPEHLLRQWKNLFTLLVNQFMTFFERRVIKENSIPILFMLDEFPRLGKIPHITDALATLRAKKITICLIIQSLAQLDDIYERNKRKVIADLCDFKAVLSATDAETQEYFSKIVGTYHKIKPVISQDFDYTTGGVKGKHTSIQKDKEPIIKPEEFANLKDIVLLHKSPRNFCMVQKQPYYEKSSLKKPDIIHIKKYDSSPANALLGIATLGLYHNNKFAKDLVTISKYALDGNIQQMSIKEQIVAISVQLARFDIGWLFWDDAQMMPNQNKILAAFNGLVDEYNWHVTEYIQYRKYLKSIYGV